MLQFELDKFNRNVSDEELIADLKLVAHNLRSGSVTRLEYKQYGKFGVTIFQNRFGSWSNAVINAGLSSGKSRDNIVIKDEELIADLKLVSRKLNNDSITRDEYGLHGKYHSATLEYRFGSWIKAKEKAGLKRRAHPSISDEEYFANLENVWIQLGKQPHFRHMRAPLSKYSGSGYVHNFGSWRKALGQFIKYINKVENKDDDNLSLAKIPSVEHSEGHQTHIHVGKIPSAKRIKSYEQERDGHKTKREVNDRLRFKVMRRDNFKCQFCGRSPATESGIVLHVDHIRAWSKGGETMFDNLRTLCSKCNIGKGNLE
jgi:hypothetical protein